MSCGFNTIMDISRPFLINSKTTKQLNATNTIFKYKKYIYSKSDKSSSSSSKVLEWDGAYWGDEGLYSPTFTIDGTC